MRQTEGQGPRGFRTVGFRSCGGYETEHHKGTSPQNSQTQTLGWRLPEAEGRGEGGNRAPPRLPPQRKAIS